MFSFPAIENVDDFRDFFGEPRALQVFLVDPVFDVFDVVLVDFPADGAVVVRRFRLKNILLFVGLFHLDLQGIGWLDALVPELLAVV